ncbi:MAG: DUF4058 family protein [Planctomycetota bacterium]|nr:DUF4058 family protein [Planctomycetota bacterium]
MPLHDWTRVAAGIYHDFHNAWITELRNSLNDGRLPPDLYALGEQRSGDIGPDVLALHDSATPVAESSESASPFAPDPSQGGSAVALADAPPVVALTQDAQDDINFYRAKQRSIVIRHVSGDRIVALIEIVSPANKHARRTLDDFLDKVSAALQNGIHVLVIDPFPAGDFDPDGIHGAIWESLLAGTYEAPTGKTQTLVSYACRNPITAYIEPISVGTTLAEMPLFLTAEFYVPVPLEETYLRAWNGVPLRWRRVIDVP